MAELKDSVATLADSVARVEELLTRLTEKQTRRPKAYLGDQVRGAKGRLAKLRKQVGLNGPSPVLNAKVVQAGKEATFWASTSASYSVLVNPSSSPSSSFSSSASSSKRETLVVEAEKEETTVEPHQRHPLQPIVPINNISTTSTTTAGWEPLRKKSRLLDHERAPVERDNKSDKNNRRFGHRVSRGEHPDVGVPNVERYVSSATTTTTTTRRPGEC